MPLVLVLGTQPPCLYDLFLPQQNMFPLVAEQPFPVLRHLMMLAGVRWSTFGIESEVLAAQNAHLQLVDQDDDDRW